MLDEDEIMEVLQTEGIDAEDLLVSKIPNVRRRWGQLCRSMKKLLADVQEEFPDAEYYTAGGGFHLLLGSSHTLEGNPQYELNALNGVGVQVGDGDW